MPATYTWHSAQGTLAINLESTALSTGIIETLTIGTDPAGNRTFSLSDYNLGSPVVFTRSGGNAAPGGGTNTLTFDSSANLGTSIIITNTGSDGGNNVEIGAGAPVNLPLATGLTISLTSDPVQFGNYINGFGSTSALNLGSGNLTIDFGTSAFAYLVGIGTFTGNALNYTASTLPDASGIVQVAGNFNTLNLALNTSVGPFLYSDADTAIINSVTRNAGTSSATLALTSGIFSPASSASFGANVGLTISGEGTAFNLNGVAAALASLDGDGTVGLGLGANLSVAAGDWSGALTGSGALTKIGAGEFSLSGASTNYNGVITVNAGTLRVSNENALGTTAGNTIVQDGATLRIDDITLNEPIRITGTGVDNNGALIANGDSADTIINALTVATAASIGGTRQMNLPAQILSSTPGMPFTLTKVGANTVVIGGTGNQFADIGDVFVNAGTLSFNTNGTMGASASTITVGSGATLSLAGNATYAKSVVLQNNGTISGASGAPTFDGSLTFDGVGNFYAADGGRLTILSPIQLGPDSVITGTGTHTGTVNFSGNISDTLTSGPFPSSVVNRGSGTLRLSGDNTFKGGVVVFSGTIIAAHAHALGTLDSGTIVAGTLGLEGNISLANEAITVIGAGVNNAGAIRNVSGNNTFSSPINMVVNSLSGGSNVLLQQSTANYSEPGFSPAGMIDGITTDFENGWANGGNPFGNTAVFEVSENLNPTGVNTNLIFRILSGGFSQYTLGKFKLYVTTADRDTFANGASNSGQIGDDWIEVVPFRAISTGGAILTINEDNSIIASGPDPDPDTYIISALVNFPNITGVRIDTIQDESFINNGPGRSVNGNYLIMEFGVEVAPADTANLTIGSSAGTLTIQAPIVNAHLRGNVTFTGAGNIVLTPDSGIHDGESSITNVIKEGSGTLTNLALNSYTGITRIIDGTYVAGTATALGTPAGGTTIDFRGTLALQGDIDVADDVTITTNTGGNRIVNLSGANTLSGTISTATSSVTINPFTGGDDGEGLDLRGIFLTAVNVGGDAKSSKVQSVAFTPTQMAGTDDFILNASTPIPDWFTPAFGSTSNDEILAGITKSIHQANANNGRISGTFTSLNIGDNYKMQFIIQDGFNTHRSFDIYVNGDRILPNYTVLDHSPARGDVVSYTFTANATAATFSLVGNTNLSADTYPILNAITLEINPVPTPATLGIRSEAGELTINGGFSIASTNLIISGAGNLNLHGALTGDGGSIFKEGSGTATLAGANSYTGTTTQQGGTLILKNESAAGTGAFVSNGGTLQIDSATTTTGKASLASFSAGSGSTMLLQLRGSNPGTAVNGYDQIEVLGNANLTDMTLVVSTGTYVPDTATYTIITAASITGEFASLPDGSIVAASDSTRTFIIHYTPTAVTLTTIYPAPSITLLAPTNGASVGGTTVAITGTGFTSATSVMFGANPASFVVESDTQITATTPPGTGTVDVMVTTPGGTTTNTAADDYTYTAGTGPVLLSVKANGSHALEDGNQPSGYFTFSRLVSLDLTFDSNIAAVLPGAFTLTSGAFTLTNEIEVLTSVAGNVVTLTFTGATGVEFGSLETGIWILTTDLSKVENTASTAGAGSVTTDDGAGTGVIRRLFGDINGDGQVDSGDFGVFGATFGLNSSDPNFEAQFDVDGNGDIDSGDFGAFGARFGTGL